MPKHGLGSLNFTNNKPSLSAFQLNTLILANVYTTTRNYSVGLQLDQANQYNRMDLFAVNPLAYSSIYGIGASNSCGCPSKPGYNVCCPVQYTTNTCGVVNSVGQCVNANPF